MKELIWSEDQICCHFKEAANKNHAVNILAQCNGVAREDIIACLARHGIEYQYKKGHVRSAGRIAKNMVFVNDNPDPLTVVEAAENYDIPYNRLMYYMYRGKVYVDDNGNRFSGV